MNTEAPLNLIMVPGYGDKYAATPDGRIFNIRTHHELKPNFSNKGRYCRVRLSGCNKAQEYVHIMIAKAFLPNPVNKPQVNHKNGDKQDNRVENLEWMTCAENLQHAFEQGLYPRQRVHPADKSKVVALVRQGVSKAEVAATYGLKRSGLDTLLWRYRRTEHFALAA